MDGNVSEFSSLEQEAVSENTASDRLWELARASTELARLVAQNSNASPELLQELSASDNATIRENVAANPNTPTEILLKLGAEFPQQMLDNPLFSLLLLENPNLVDEMSLLTLQSIVKQENVLVYFLERAEKRSNSQRVSREDQLVLEAIARSPQTPGDILARLVEGSQVSWLGKLIALHPNTPENALEKLAEQENDEMRRYVVQHPNTPKSVLAKLAEVPITKWNLRLAILKSIAQHPNTPTITLELLAEDQTEVANTGRDVRIAVAENPNTPLKVLEKLAWDKHAWVRRAVAVHPNVSERLLLQIAMHQVATWKRRIIPTTMTLEQAALEIANHLWCVKQPNTPVDVFEQFAEHRWDAVRLAIAMNPNIPENVLDRLSKDREFIIREWVARNPKTSADTLACIVSMDEATCIRIVAADNPNTPSNAIPDGLRGNFRK